MGHPAITYSPRLVIYEDGSGTSLSVPFPIFSWDDIEVFDGAGSSVGFSGVETITQPIAGGTILLDGPVTGPITIKSTAKPERLFDFIEGAGLPIDVLNTDLDRLFALAQEAYRDIEAAEEAVARVEDDAASALSAAAASLMAKMNGHVAALEAKISHLESLVRIKNTPPYPAPRRAVGGFVFPEARKASAERCTTVSDLRRSDEVGTPQMRRHCEVLAGGFPRRSHGIKAWVDPRRGYRTPTECHLPVRLADETTEIETRRAAEMPAIGIVIVGVEEICKRIAR